MTIDFAARRARRRSSSATPRLALLARRGARASRMSAAPLLEVVDLDKAYRLQRPRPFAPHPVRPALAGVSFSVVAGRSFGIVGESGSGKSTLARIALALDRPDSGVVRLEGRSLFELSRASCRRRGRTCR